MSCLCILCKSDKQNPDLYGEFLNKSGISVHTYCLYLTSNLVQNGTDDEGIYGFLPHDIFKEVKRISKLKCCYCRKYFAGIGCCNISCTRSFHLTCGIENGAINQFNSSFSSYCHMHYPKVVIQKPPPSNELCCICCNELLTPRHKSKQHNLDVLLVPCCQNGWFHKLCLQKFALNAGYFFKCPLCNDTPTFREKLPLFGIYIPDRDALWELEPNAYSELLERPKECSAIKCKNKMGRLRESKNNYFVICETCGSKAIHKNCLLGKKASVPQQIKELYNCTECSNTLGKLNISQPNADNTFVEMDNYDNKSDSTTIDVCSISECEGDNDNISNNNISNKLFRDMIKNYESSTLKRRSTESIAKLSTTDCEKNRESPVSTSTDDIPIFQAVLKKSRKKYSACLFNSDDEQTNIFKNEKEKDGKNISKAHTNDRSPYKIETIRADADNNNGDNGRIDYHHFSRNTNYSNMEYNLEKPTTSKNNNHKITIHENNFNEIDGSESSNQSLSRPDRHKECSAIKCENKMGRLRESKYNYFVTCETCGFKAIHKNCLLGKKASVPQQIEELYNCTECSNTLGKLNISQPNADNTFVEMDNYDNKSDSTTIDVCCISECEDDNDNISNNNISNKLFRDMIKNYESSTLKRRSTESIAKLSTTDCEKNRESPVSTSTDDIPIFQAVLKKSRKKYSACLFNSDDEQTNIFKNEKEKDGKNISKAHTNDRSPYKIETIRADADNNNGDNGRIDYHHFSRNTNYSNMEYNLEKPTTSKNNNHKITIHENNFNEIDGSESSNQSLSQSVRKGNKMELIPYKVTTRRQRPKSMIISSTSSESSYHCTRFTKKSSTESFTNELPLSEIKSRYTNHIKCNKQVVKYDTRRCRTARISSTSTDVDAKQNINLNISCIALRTRRRTTLMSNKSKNQSPGSVTSNEEKAIKTIEYSTHKHSISSSESAVRNETDIVVRTKKKSQLFSSVEMCKSNKQQLSTNGKLTANENPKENVMGKVKNGKMKRKRHNVSSKHRQARCNRITSSNESSTTQGKRARLCSGNENDEDQKNSCYFLRTRSRITNGVPAKNNEERQQSVLSSTSSSSRPLSSLSTSSFCSISKKS